MVTARSKAALAMVGALTASTGCTSTFQPCQPTQATVEPAYIRADYVAERSLQDTKAEVTAANVYRQEHTKWKTVAIRLPDTCVTESAATATGTSSSAETIMANACAFWLKELESALSGAGFRVISWDALKRTLMSGDVSTYAAAANLGADIVFLVDMDLADKTLTTESRLTSTISKADATGQRVANPFEDADWIREFNDYWVNRLAPEMMRSEIEITAMSAWLDLTAVVAATGETAWFYRHSVALPEGLAERQALSVLLVEVPSKTDPGKVQRYPVWPRGVSEANAAPPSTKTVTNTSTKVRPADQEREIELKLVRSIVKDFVSAFTGGSP